MKSIKLTIACLLLCIAGVGNAMADHGRHAHIGVVIGPYWGPWYYPPQPYYYPSPYYYPPYYSPVTVERSSPPVYVEQQAAPPVSAPVAPAPQINYWYYCNASNGYYPYVKVCPEGWQKVSPQPPGQP